MAFDLQNFYKQTLLLDWSIGTGNFYVSVKPTISSGWLVISPNNSTIREIIKYTATGTDSNGDYVTVSQRGVGGTTEQIHTQGEPIRMNITAEYWDDMNDQIANIVAAGVVDATTTTMGGVEIATDAEVLAGTNTGGTGASLVATPGQIFKGVSKTTTTTSSATPTINTDTYNRLTLTAQTVDITSMTTNLSGTPTDGQKLQIRITPVGRTPATSYIATSATNNTASNIVITKPTGTTDGDIMLAVISRYGGGSYPTVVPSGWTLLAQNNGTDSWSLYYKIAASEGANYTWEFAGAYTLVGRIVTYRGGFNPTNPVDLNCISNTIYQTSNTTVRAASVGVPKAYSTLIYWGNFVSPGTFTKPSVPTTDWVEDLDADDGYFATTLCRMVWTSSGATGNVDATASATITEKHAFLIALNPEIDVTWGASFSEAGMDLPTKMYSPSATTIDFIYNSTTSKWETSGEDTYKNNSNSAIGATTHDISTTTTKTIAHGLSKRPKIVRISGKASSGGSFCSTDTIYKDTTQCSNYSHGDTSSGTQEGSGAAFRFSGDSGTSNYLDGVVTVDSTNITITWSKTGTPTGTAYLIWEAEI